MYKMRTTIQISDNIRKRLKVLASYRDVSYEDVLDDMINVFSASIPFRNKEEFSQWFEKNITKFGFKKIIEKRPDVSPEYRLEDENGNERRVEPELLADDFVRHGHDPKNIDLIVCLYSDKEKINDVPVLSIIHPPKDPREIIKRMEGRYETILIPKPLFEKIKESIQKTGFTSVSEYVTFVLREIIASKEEKEPFTPEDEEKVKERLRALGYLD